MWFTTLLVFFCSCVLVAHAAGSRLVLFVVFFALCAFTQVLGDIPGEPAPDHLWSVELCRDEPILARTLRQTTREFELLRLYGR